MSAPVIPPGSEVTVRLVGDSATVWPTIIGIVSGLAAIAAVAVSAWSVRQAYEGNVTLDERRWQLQQRRELYARFLRIGEQTIDAAVMHKPGGDGWQQLNELATEFDEVKLIGSDEFVAAGDRLVRAIGGALGTAEPHPYNEVWPPTPETDDEVIQAMWTAHAALVAQGRKDLEALRPAKGVAQARPNA